MLKSSAYGQELFESLLSTRLSDESYLFTRDEATKICTYLPALSYVYYRLSGHYKIYKKPQNTSIYLSRARVSKLIRAKYINDSQKDDTKKPIAGVIQDSQKDDTKKPIAGVIQDFSRALYALTELMTYGANKYERGSWQSVKNGKERYTDAFFRHILKETTEIVDPETGIHHDIATLFNNLVRVELRLREEEK